MYHHFRQLILYKSYNNLSNKFHKFAFNDANSGIKIKILVLGFKIVESNKFIFHPSFHVVYPIHTSNNHFPYIWHSLKKDI